MNLWLAQGSLFSKTNYFSFFFFRFTYILKWLRYLLVVVAVVVNVVVALISANSKTMANKTQETIANFMIQTFSSGLQIRSLKTTVLLSGFFIIFIVVLLNSPSASLNHALRDETKKISRLLEWWALLSKTYIHITVLDFKQFQVSEPQVNTVTDSCDNIKAINIFE